MAYSKGVIRLIFGLKLRQLRLDKGISLSELANQSGLSASYITEIEKGKKYPKIDKIQAIAAVLGTDYDTLVSLKLSKKLEPISVLLRSNILTELPLELFGIDPATLLELLSEAPAKTSAFIGTLIEIARNYNVSTEQFYFSALRTYQEMHNNYFEDIELEAERFLAERNISITTAVSDKAILDILKGEFGYNLDIISTAKSPELAEIRSLTIPRPDGYRLLVSELLSRSQRAFIYGRELGYHFLGIRKRLYTTDLARAESFDQILGNYKASYFASAILIRRDLLAKHLEEFFAAETFKPELLLDAIYEFNTTPESFFYRISNVLPKYFGIDQLFFLRFNNYAGHNRFDLTKEMHLTRKHNPHTIRDEHYCRRWIGLTSLQELAEKQAGSDQDILLCRGQISYHGEFKEEYLEITFAKPLVPHKSVNISVTMGIFLNANTRKIINFLDDPAIRHRQVGETCERCAIFDCRDRVAAPIVLQKRRHLENLQKAVDQLLKE